jgi:hypothetical protein
MSAWVKGEDLLQCNDVCIGIRKHLAQHAHACGIRPLLSENSPIVIAEKTQGHNTRMAHARLPSHLIEPIDVPDVEGEHADGARRGGRAVGLQPERRTNHCCGQPAVQAGWARGDGGGEREGPERVTK